MIRGMAHSSNGGVSSPPPKAQELTGRVMNFLSTANGETIGACVVGLGAVTYFVLGRVGLVLIGAVGGVVWHATWEDQEVGTKRLDAGEGKRRNKISLDIVKQLLEMQKNKSSETTTEKNDPKADTDLVLASGKDLNFAEFPPETRSALTQLVDASIREYVKFWYSPILPQEVLFPYACRQTLVSFLLSLSRHVARKRPADAFVNFLTNSTSIFIVFLSELSHALMAPGMYDRDVGEAIKIYLEEKPDSSLANLMNRDEQEKKLNGVARDMLETFLDSKTYNCEPARVFFEQVLGKMILGTVLHNSSQAYWINDWIIYLFEEGDPELMNAIDAGVGGATGGQDAKTMSKPQDPQQSSHARRKSKTEDAMEDAMSEVKRLNDMIAEDEARKARDKDGAEDAISMVSTERQVATPTSSQSGRESADDDGTNAAVGAQQVSHPEEDYGESEPTPAPTRAFTSFDQLVPPHHDSADASERPPPLTLHWARITLFDDEKPGEKGTFRSKPMIEYLIQIEPASSHHSGWMSARKYSDFETLHEFTSRVAKISGIAAFSQKHQNAPSWKGKTKSALRNELETYLQDALSHEGLAESEGMKRFLEKERALGRPEPSKGVLGFPTPDAFQTMGKGMLDVMTSAPKGMADGGQALFKGVTGVFAGPKRTTSSASSNTAQPRSLHRTDSSQSQHDMSSSQSSLGATSSFQPRPSRDGFGASPASSTDVLEAPPLPSRPTTRSSESVESSQDATQSNAQATSLVDSTPAKSEASDRESAGAATDSDLGIKLPPPPSDITDDYRGPSPQPVDAGDEEGSREARHEPRVAPLVAPISPPRISNTDDLDPIASSELSPPPTSRGPTAAAPSVSPLSEDETQVAIELLFAVINELYTLSSAWQIRRTLLNTAKSFLLRPGNASLTSIRTLLQESVLDAHLSDAGIATQLRTMRANALPTPDEMALWPEWPPAPDTQARMQDKARRLFVTRGLPPALTSVMGAAASQEALARVFDALQVEEVARGLMFALLLQGVRAVTH